MAEKKEETDAGIAKAQDEKPINEVLGDVGKLSYIGAVSITIGLMYPGEWHRKWRQELIKKLGKHLKLPKDSLHVMENMMEELADQENQALYIKKLTEYPSLTKNVLLLHDFLDLALKCGSYNARMRVLIYKLAELCNVDPEEVCQHEQKLVENFIQAQAEMTELV